MEIEKSTILDRKVELYVPMEKTESGYIAVLSDDSIDRSDEVVGKEALLKIEKEDKFEELAGFIDHETKVLNQVCKWTNKRVVDIDGHTCLVAEPVFFKSNPNAMIIKGMLDEGARFGVSIGAIVKDYMEKSIEGAKRIVYTSLELVEASFVGIPCNRYAMVTAVKKHYTGGKSMEDTFTQKDIDSAVNKAVEEKSSELNKDIQSLKSEKAELEKSLDAESQKAAELEKSVADVKKELEEAEAKIAELGNTIKEKGQFSEGTGLDKIDDSKELEKGNLPVFTR